jgi:hypothetical protein
VARPPRNDRGRARGKPSQRPSMCRVGCGNSRTHTAPETRFRLARAVRCRVRRDAPGSMPRRFETRDDSSSAALDFVAPRVCHPELHPYRNPSPSIGGFPCAPKWLSSYHDPSWRNDEAMRRANRSTSTFFCPEPNHFVSARPRRDDAPQQWPVARRRHGDVGMWSSQFGGPDRAIGNKSDPGLG